MYGQKAAVEELKNMGAEIRATTNCAFVSLSGGKRETHVSSPMTEIQAVPGAQEVPGAKFGNRVSIAAHARCR